MIENSLLNEVVLALNIPQGSILGPSECSDFTEPVGQLIRSKSVTPHFYADDSQLYVHYNPNNPDVVQDAVLKIDQCCRDKNMDDFKLLEIE